MKKPRIYVRITSKSTAAFDTSRSASQSATEAVVLPHLEDLHASEPTQPNHRQSVHRADINIVRTYRSYARLPEILESLWAPPRVSSRSLHSPVVDESCHIGHLVVENAIESS